MTAVVLGALIVAAGVGWPAQPAAAQPDPSVVEVDAIQCWRRLGRNAVAVGERFSVTLTCAVVETDDARVVPDETALAPGMIDVTPFEVVGGRRYADIRNGPRRFFQYEYTLRIIGEDVFGVDVALPSLDVRYRIERNLGSAAALPGRELIYVLPAESVRVLSLVPEDRADIREVAGESFGDIEARRFRARLMMLAAVGLGTAALGALVLAAARFRRERRIAAAPARQRVPSAAVVRRVAGELAMIDRERQEQGWTPELTGRALAAFRLAGAVAVSRPVAQTALEGLASSPAGGLRVRCGFWRPAKTAVSSALTAEDLTRELARIRANHTGGPDQVVLLEDLHRALVSFTAARYGAAAGLDGDGLTSDFDRAVEAVGRLHRRILLPLERVRRVTRAAREWRRRLWPA